MLLSHRHHALYALRENPIVRKHNLAVLAVAGNLPERLILIGNCGQELLIFNDSDSRIPLSIRTRYISRPVRAAIVYDYVLPVFVRLCYNAFDALADVLSTVVQRSDYADCGISFGHAVPSHSLSTHRRVPAGFPPAVPE